MNPFPTPLFTRLNARMLLGLFIGLLPLGSLQAQSKQLTKDYSYALEIPEITTMTSSPAHLYVLSEQEGLVVFRTHQDSLQYLYTSPGMQKRGHVLQADIRFAYMYGQQKRFTVVEPTSVLGVYSATNLPQEPEDVARQDMDLYLAMNQLGLGYLSLKTPETVDTTLTFPFKEALPPQASITQLESTPSQLFALSSDGQLFLFTRQEGKLNLDESLRLNQPIERLFLDRQTLLGSTSDGQLFEIQGNGRLKNLTSLPGSITKVQRWGSYLVLQDDEAKIWLLQPEQGKQAQPWGQDPTANYQFTVSKGQFWVHEFGQIFRLQSGASASTTTATQLDLLPINRQVIPYPHPLLLPIQFEQDVDLNRVQLTYRSHIQNAEVRGQSLYWQPEANQVGQHQFTLIATDNSGQVDSTNFVVDVRSFNAPPRFVPLRNMRIRVNQSFTLPIRARDPDGSDPNLIRYVGVDLPQGATVDEHSGLLSWTPSPRQVGEHQIQVIATDQYGSAASVSLTLTVDESIEQQ
jgi:hypothetical protein